MRLLLVAPSFDVATRTPIDLAFSPYCLFYTFFFLLIFALFFPALVQHFERSELLLRF